MYSRRRLGEACFAPLLGNSPLFLASRSGNTQRCSMCATSASYTRRLRDAWPKHELEQLPKHLRPKEDETLDLILRRKLFITQSRKGYRANVDGDCLAYFAWDAICRSKGRSPARVVDLGAGNGMVSLLLGLRSGRNPELDLTLVEFQEALADRARRNLALNGLDGRVLLHDLSSPPATLSGSADLVVSNPPFYLPNTRAPPRSREKHLAHVESSASLFDFTRAARSVLSPDPSARFCMIHDVRQLDRIRRACEASGLQILSIVEIFQTETETTGRVLLETSIRSELSAICREARGSLCLHPFGCGEKLYCSEIESFLAIMPEPLWPIGSLDVVGA